MWCTPFQFQSPCSIMVVGPSSCGKTVFVENLMKERSHLFSPPCNPVVYCYGANQPTTFERMKKEQGICFHEGIPDTPLLDTWYKNARGGILILDDLCVKDRTILESWISLPENRIIKVSTWST